MTTMEDLRLRREQEGEKRLEALRQIKIRAKCPTTDESGRLVRGYVTQVRCAGCGSPRWNDGTPCGIRIVNKIDAKITRVCGHRTVRDIEVMEDGRIG